MLATGRLSVDNERVIFRSIFWSAVAMRVMFSRLFVGLLLTGLSVSGVVAQEKKQQVAEELPTRIEPDQAKWYAHYKKQALSLIHI